VLFGQKLQPGFAIGSNQEIWLVYMPGQDFNLLILNTHRCQRRLLACKAEVICRLEFFGLPRLKGRILAYLVKWVASSMALDFILFLFVINTILNTIQKLCMIITQQKKID